MQEKVADILRYLKSNKDYPFIKHPLYTAIESCYRENSNNKLEFPLGVGIKITTKCNLSCDFCWADNSNEGLSDEAINNTIDWLIRKGVLEFTLSGGEPLLSPQVYNLVKKIKSFNRSLHVYTNGLLIEKNEKVFELFNKNMDFVQVSFDAYNSELFTYIRGSDKYDDLINGIKLLKMMNIPFRLHMTVTQKNINYIYETYLLAAKLNADVFSIGLVFPMNKGEKYKEFISEDFIDKYVNGLYQCLNKKTKTYFEFFLPHQVIWKYCNPVTRQNTSNSKIILIKEGNCYFHINSCGEVYPSNYIFDEKFKIFSINEEKVEEKFKSNFLYGLRILKDKICLSCTCLDICLGGDYVSSYNKYGTIDLGDPDCPLRLNHVCDF